MYTKQVIFSDLDGTLLDKNTYSYQQAQESLETLKQLDIPLIICTSKTRSEIDQVRKKLKNSHPFISENGGAIFIPKNYFGKSTRKTRDGYELIEFGTPYKSLVKTIDKLKKNFQIKNFQSMTAKEISKHSGLTIHQARLSKIREYDEVFILENRSQEKKLEKEIKKLGLNLVKGGRYFHLLGNNDKGKAVKELLKLYKEKFGEIQSISFGDAPNDIPMLNATTKGFKVKGPSDLNKKIINILGTKNKFIQEGNSLYNKSLDLLSKFQQPNGAILASFPNSRYPYVYPRDHAICTLALLESGNLVQAKKAINFILNGQHRNGSFPQRLSAEGYDRSYKPIQLDNTGLPVYCFAKYIKLSKDKKFLRKHKKKITKSINYLKSQLQQNNLFFTPNSIHEFPPLEQGLEAWANAIAYASLKELEDIGFNIHIKLSKIKKAIEKYFWNGKYFIKTIRIKESSSVSNSIDASASSFGYFDIFEPSNIKVKKTISTIEKELWHKKLGGICRYKKFIDRNNGGWGPWPHFTLMIARHFIKAGQKAKAEKYIQWVINIALEKQLPEHIATKSDFEEWVNAYKSAGILRPDRKIMVENIRSHDLYKSGLAYSVTPLAWPHAEFVRTWQLYKNKFL